MKKSVAWIAGCLLSGIVSAQHVVDGAVATELLRGSTGGLAVNALQTNENFLRQYTMGVLEQELAQEAARRGLDERLDIQRALHASRMKVLIQALHSEVTKGVESPSDEDVEKTYQNNPERFRVGEAAKVDVLAFAAEDKNAKKFSRDAVKSRKIKEEDLEEIPHRWISRAEGEGGWVTKTSFPEELWEAILSSEKGDVVAFPLEERVLLVKVHDRREERQATLEEAEQEIARLLKRQRQQAIWAEFIQEHQRQIGLRK